MKKFNPLQDREDLITQLLFPVISWSSMNQFESYDKEKWYKNYVLGIKDPPNAAMQAGIEIGEKLATDPTFMPEVPRPEIYEHEARIVFSGITLRGHMDGWSPKIKELLEYKTTTNQNKWTKETVRQHGQLDFYCLLLFLTETIKPEDIYIRLISIPVKETGHFEIVRSNEPIKIIETKRTMQNILNFGVRIKKVYKEMKEYVASYPHFDLN